MLSIISTKKYERSLQKCLKIKKFSVSRLESVISKLQKQTPLDKKYEDHLLKGRFLGKRECHIYPDILLIYEILNKELILVLVDINSHSDLF